MPWFSVQFEHPTMAENWITSAASADACECERQFYEGASAHPSLRWRLIERRPSVYYPDYSGTYVLRTSR